MSEETNVQPQEPLNIAAMMAKEGQKTDDSPVQVPVQNTPPPQVEQPKVTQQDETKAETVNVPPAPPAAAEPPKPEPVRTEPAAAPVAPVQQPAQPVDVDWKELLKKQPETDVLKAVGLDDKMINFLSRWKSGEDLKDYLEAVTTDYSKMSPEELLRRQLYREFGSLSAEDFEEVYKMKVTEQYKLDSDIYDEKEVRRGRLMLGIDADRVRQEFIKKQQELLLSKPPEAGPSTADIEAKAQEEQRLKDFQAYKGLVDNNELTKQLVTSKLLKIGDGEKAFNLEVTNPNDVLDLLYDSTKWTQKMWNADGTPNIRKQLIIAAIANDDEAFFSNWAKHYEMLGEKSIAERIQNASEPAAGTFAKGNAESSDPISQLARFGTITSG
jgi:hypothetical protein